MKRRRLTVAVAPGSFKGTLTAGEAALCIETGLRRVPGAFIVLRTPMADGGEGTVETIVDATGGRLVSRTVSDPLGRSVRATFGLTGDGRTAVIEMAAASGLVLLKPKERNPMVTSTFGTGQLIRHALDQKVRRILIGIGGSATNDGGTGMARALGARFLDSSGGPLPDGGGALVRLDRIDLTQMDPRLKTVTIDVACDVNNPLTGARGATRTYGLQKGATPAMIGILEAGLVSLSNVIRRDLGLDIRSLPGGGAAGGLGAGLVAFAGGTLSSGVDVVMDVVDIARRIRGCDIVITGEGRMDWQTAYGKTPVGVARVAKSLGIPVIAICGSLGKGVDRVLDVGIDAYFSSLSQSVPDEDLSRVARPMLTDCAEQVGRLLMTRGPLSG